ncbi:hypothetical protein SGRI78S_02852 [Streptomyces griseus subsp. griseus]
MASRSPTARGARLCGSLESSAAIPHVLLTAEYTRPVPTPADSQRAAGKRMPATSPATTSEPAASRT